MREVPDAAGDATGVPSPAMSDDERPEPGRTLSVRLDVQLDAQPITGRLRTDGGEDEPFVGWLGFIDTLRRLSGPQDSGNPAPDPSD
jgi:hypothetical protein